jgi:hypothetical protein
VSDATIEQIASINLSILQDSKVNSQMRQDMTSKIEAATDKAKTSFPSMPTKNNSDIKNIIEKNINESFSQDAIADMKLSIDNQINISASGSNIQGLSLIQKADAIGKIVNGMSADIVQEIMSDNAMESIARDKETFYLADMIDSAGGAASGVIDSAGGAASGVISSSGDALSTVVDSAAEATTLSTGTKIIIVIILITIILGGMTGAYLKVTGHIGGGDEMSPSYKLPAVDIM